VEILEAIKIVCLFFGIWWSIVNAMRIIFKNDLPAINIFIQSLGITGFICLQWIIK
jgi:hypothetical protein